MGRYSYSQPSSSDEFDMTSLLEAEAALYANEAESSYNVREPVYYPPQPECDDGIPRICYCGSEPVVKTSLNPKDPGRKYFSCHNVEDGDFHIWKRWDVAVVEELSDLQRQLNHLKVEGTESEQKVAKLEQTVSELSAKSDENVAKLEKTVSELSVKKSGVTNRSALVVCVLVSVVVLIVLLVMLMPGGTWKA